MSAAAGPVHWDPFNPEYFADPHPVFARMRNEAPLYYNEQYDFYAISRYDDVQASLADYETFSSARGDILEFIKANNPIPPGVFIMSDPPVHTMYRSPLTKIFTPRRMSALEPQIRAFCARALDPLVEEGEFDFIEHLGKDMPMRVIGMLLGIPEQDLKTVQREADAKLITEAGKPMQVSEQNFTGSEFGDYIDWRMKNPSDDLMTEMLNIEFTDQTGNVRKFTRDEVIIICTILGGAGNETTNRLIGWTGKVLAEHPDQRRQIHEDRKLIPQAIEELLRYEPPGPSVARYVTRDIELHGAKVPAGSAMCLIVAAGNRDERKFANPDQFNIHRERAPHLTFGHGFHVCLGNALARLEGRVALDELLNRFPEWDVDLENAALTSTSTVRGWETLPAYTPKAKRNGARRKPAQSAAPAAPAALSGSQAWKLVMKTPMGPQEMTAHLLQQGETLLGHVESPMGSESIKDGKVAGGKLTWTISVTKPAALQIKFDLQVNEGVMTGQAALGAFGSAEITGERLSS